MNKTDIIKQYAERKLREICKSSQGKPIPNWHNIEDMQGFSFRITEGELKLVFGITVYPVDEVGPGNFLVRLIGTFVNDPVIRDGYEFQAAPLGLGIQMDHAMFAEGEQELMDGVLEWIYDEADNILCQILE
ncbi:hypothetical protein AH04_52 [Erwinia phage AH04]|uniref:Uncharacterized protein n=1 Tax=Erwinia phage AH04 TaxID=2869569 RepID=A0AAE7X1N5_9CAUD|nr:hypothetical protein PQC02_gp262 [Erwinia phage AH04]QZA70536.1 hypothetical protein AH04_52 [Erwinia phage AH04]